LKSLHTAAEARGQGVARALLEHLLGLARSRGYRLVSLETGSMAAFAPARALYEASGFDDCPHFADYLDSPHSTFMSLALTTPKMPRRHTDPASSFRRDGLLPGSLEVTCRPPPAALG
jgi:ribosomal protein S18 acetylase RimI-like enzyme